MVGFLREMLRRRDDGNLGNSDKSGSFPVADKVELSPILSAQEILLGEKRNEGYWDTKARCPVRSCDFIIKGKSTQIPEAWRSCRYYTLWHIRQFHNQDNTLIDIVKAAIPYEARDEPFDPKIVYPPNN